MRTTYLVCYDIADPKRLRRAFRICKNYGLHLQYSVFECDLSPAERVGIETQLRDLIDHSKDQVLFVTLGPTEGRGERVISAIGTPYCRMDSPCYVC
jgi:CRISPR-associated protein Cas2